MPSPPSPPEMCQAAQAGGTSRTKPKLLAPLVKQSSNPFSQLLLPLTHLLGASFGFVTHKLTRNWPSVPCTKAREGRWLRSSGVDLDRNTEPLASLSSKTRGDTNNSLWLHRQFSLCCVFAVEHFDCDTYFTWGHPVICVRVFINITVGQICHVYNFWRNDLGMFWRHRSSGNNNTSCSKLNFKNLLILWVWVFFFPRFFRHTHFL